MAKKTKQLSLVGSGIKTIAHLTKESEAHISQAEHVLYLVNEPIMMQWVKDNSRSSCSLETEYFSKKIRQESYRAITTSIIDSLARYDFVCVVIYGHPTIFSSPGVKAIEIAEDMGVETAILPSISAEDCLFADLRIDPGDCGCFSVEAMDFLIRDRNFDTNSHLIIWQAGMIGNLGHPKEPNKKAIKVLEKHLLNHYPEKHTLIIYEASIYPGLKFSRTDTVIGRLSEETLSTITTIYIPPVGEKLTNNSILLEMGLQVPTQ